MKRNKEFEELQNHADELTQAYSQVKLPMKRRSLALQNQDPMDSPFLPGKKRKLTNTKRKIQKLEDDSDDDLETPPPNRE